jgi:hypothetical protein
MSMTRWLMKTVIGVTPRLVREMEGSAKALSRLSFTSGIERLLQVSSREPLICTFEKL